MHWWTNMSINEQRDWLAKTVAVQKQLIEGLEGLLVCYRSHIRPGESLLDRIHSARSRLRELETGPAPRA